MLEHVKHVVMMNAEYARMHLQDIPPEKWCEAPESLHMHPASIIGHMVASYVMARTGLGGDASLPAGWPDGLATTTAAELDASQYPAKDAMLAALDEHRAGLLAMLEAATAEGLAQPLPDEKMRPFIPTVGVMLLLSLTVHESLHLGQLSAWRRAMDMPLHI